MHVVETPADIVGFGSAGAARDALLGTTGEVTAIYLLDSVKRHGLGRMLFTSLMRALAGRGHASAGLWVLVDNHEYPALLRSAWRPHRRNAHSSSRRRRPARDRLCVERSLAVCDSGLGCGHLRLLPCVRCSRVSFFAGSGIMMKRSRAVSIACKVGLLALMTASLHCSAHAQSADLVLCDRLAADPADPDKPKDVKGVPDIAPSDIATAIKFCRIASASSRRALYQLGRAYAANRQMTEAIGVYRKAADKGSTSAMVELGVLLRDGLRAFPRTKSRRASCSSARPRRAIRAASPIWRPSPAVAAAPRIPSRPEPCLPKRRRRMRKRSISLD